jgi:hypothetical protein
MALIKPAKTIITHTVLAKAIIINTVTNDSIAVMYNPEEFKLEQGNNFAEVGIPGLSMDLFFDTYESRQDVRLHTGQIVNLLNTLPQTKAPPILLFTMGRFSFECVLVDAGQRFTMFLSDGTPVRATLSTRFQEYIRVDITTQQGFFLGPPALHNFAEGQTLSGLAAQYLGDAGKWRLIAEANNIDDPFHILPGIQLTIPQGRKP